MGAVVEVLELTSLSWEIVFVDDGSEDETRAIIRELCAADARCRSIFHDGNRGRGAAFKTGFAGSEGRVTGFLDIDLEVHARYIPGLVNEIVRHGADVVTGHRHFLLRQTRGLHRMALSWGYRRLCDLLLSLDLEDSETGCKFFKRETTSDVVLASENDGWFWDTEVMARARLANLRIRELPVLFLRRADKTSTVRPLRDSWAYLRALHAFRGKVGLSRRTKSPIYWTGHGYDLTMHALYAGRYDATLAAVARRIPDGASVVDLCCGTGRLYQNFLRDRRCSYLGLDFNGDFVMHARRRGVDIRWFDLLAEPIPPADYVVMCSSLYHFGADLDEMIGKMRRAANRARHRLRAGAEPVERAGGRPSRGGADQPGRGLVHRAIRSRPVPGDLRAPRGRARVRSGRPQRHRGVSVRGVLGPDPAGGGVAGGVGHAFAHRLPGQAAAGLAGPPIVYETRRRQQKKW